MLWTARTKAKNFLSHEDFLLIVMELISRKTGVDVQKSTIKALFTASIPTNSPLIRSLCLVFCFMCAKAFCKHRICKLKGEQYVKWIIRPAKNQFLSHLTLGGSLFNNIPLHTKWENYRLNNTVTTLNQGNFSRVLADTVTQTPSWNPF